MSGGIKFAIAMAASSLPIWVGMAMFYGPHAFVGCSILAFAFFLSGASLERR